MFKNSKKSRSNTAVVDASTLDSYVGDYIEHWGRMSLAPTLSLIESVRFKKGYTIVTVWTRSLYRASIGQREKLSLAPGTEVTIRFRQEEKEKE